MSRAASGDTVVVKAGSNVYTVLSLAGLIAVILALTMLFLSWKPMLGDTASMF